MAPKVLLAPLLAALLYAPAAADAAVRVHVQRSAAGIVVQVDTAGQHGVRLFLDGRRLPVSRGRRLRAVVPLAGRAGRRVVVRSRRGVVLATLPIASTVGPASTEAPVPAGRHGDLLVGAADQLAPIAAVPAGVLRGRVPLGASVPAGGARVVAVHFLVDGRIVGSDTVSPYAFTLDLARLVGGQHALVVEAVRDDGSASDSAELPFSSDPSPIYDRDASGYGSIALAIASLGPDGGTVFLPAGTYAVAGLVVPDHVSLIGAGIGQTVLRLPDNANADFVLKTFAVGTVISDLSIDANGLAQTGGTGWAIDIGPGSVDVLVQRVAVLKAATTAIYLWGPHRGVSIQDVAIDGGGISSSGVSDHIDDVDSGDTSVLRTTVAHTRDYGINLFPWTPQRSYPGARGALIGNTILDVQNPATNNGTNEGGIWSGGVDAYIADNTIDGTGWDGIETFGSSNGVHVRGNTIRNTRFGIYLEHSTNDSVFEGNTISGVTRSGIDVEWLYGGVGSQRNTFRANTITGASTGIFIDLGNGGNLIEGNTVIDSTEQGIALQGTSGNTVRDNVVRDTRATRLQAYGVRELPARAEDGALVNPGSNLITGNDARGSLRGAALVFGAGSSASQNLWG